MKPNEDFVRIIEATPLVAVDLVIHSQNGRILLGKRLNRPAQGFWFVPGGRILKGERIREAMRRIAARELGLELRPQRLLGAYDHLYPDNYAGVVGIGTHYVVLAYQFLVDESTPIRSDDQHAAMQWWEVPALMGSPDVHENTKRYFQPNELP